ncbi:unnamed protein product [Ectocarpus fasciculatus]
MYVAWTCLFVRATQDVGTGRRRFSARGRKERRPFILLYRYRVTAVFDGGRGWRRGAET